MKELIEKLLERTQLFLILIGIILVLIGTAGGFSIGTFALQISQLFGEIIVVFIGVVLTAVGVVSLWQDNRQNSAKVSPFIVTGVVRSIPELQIRNIFKIPVENPRRDERMKEVLSEYATSLALVARSGFSYLHHQGMNWTYSPKGVGMKSKLEEGIPVEVVLEDPYSENGQCRRRADGRTDPWRDVSWGRLEELVERYRNLKIYFSSAPMLCSLFFTDKSVFYDPYHFGKFPKAESSKNNFFVIEFEKPRSETEGQNYYTLLRRHFEFVRDDKMTVSFEQFRAKYSDLLKREI